LPRLNEAVNEEWISDKTRHVVDGLRVQRLDQPYVRTGGQLRAATWGAAVLNARIRKRWRAGPFAIGLIGERVDLTYPYHYLGAGPETLAELAAGRGDFAGALKQAKSPLVLLG